MSLKAETAKLSHEFGLLFDFIVKQRLAEEEHRRVSHTDGYHCGEASVHAEWRTEWVKDVAFGRERDRERVAKYAPPPIVEQIWALSRWSSDFKKQLFFELVDEGFGQCLRESQRAFARDVRAHLISEGLSEGLAGKIFRMVGPKGAKFALEWTRSALTSGVNPNVLLLLARGAKDAWPSERIDEALWALGLVSVPSSTLAASALLLDAHLRKVIDLGQKAKIGEAAVQ